MAPGRSKGRKSRTGKGSGPEAQPATATGAVMWALGKPSTCAASPLGRLNKTQVISRTCDALFSTHDRKPMYVRTGLRRTMIMQKLLALSVLVLTVFASISAPAIAADVRSERGAPGWFGPQDPSPPWAPPG